MARPSDKLSKAKDPLHTYKGIFGDVGVPGNNGKAIRAAESLPCGVRCCQTLPTPPCLRPKEPEPG